MTSLKIGRHGSGNFNAPFACVEKQEVDFAVPAVSRFKSSARFMIRGVPDKGIAPLVPRNVVSNPQFGVYPHQTLRARITRARLSGLPFPFDLPLIDGAVFLLPILVGSQAAKEDRRKANGNDDFAAHRHGYFVL
ncbi:MAG: hypothetical protein NVV74_01565 [Magnetospirillum sp.]|nr:hypothetical protein [Magnetospirillum sp.]